MKPGTVRITSISIENYKNVRFGNISLDNTRKSFKSSIMGLYGQNGSGKTALINAIELLKYALCGHSVPETFADYINVDTDIATLTFDFRISLSEKAYSATYQFSIKGIDDGDDKNIGIVEEKKKRVCIFNELLKCPILSDKQIKIGRLIDTTEEELFTPKSKRSLLIGKDKNTNTNLIVAKKMAEISSRSFVFSKELLSAVSENAKSNPDANLDFYVSIIESLVEFGNTKLFVVNTANSGLISLNAQPLVFRYNKTDINALGTIMLPLDAPVLLEIKAKELVEKITGNMNIVLQQMIPGLVIGVRELGKQIMKNGKTGCLIQLVSQKNSKEIPLKYESEGIKKIVSVLQLLIVIYNDPSVTVAIDELDSGVFEYLLGELLRIISERGKGQLIFTSHNLRPLETLDRGFVAFTTTNPERRYIRLVNVKDSNNLRDFYYRDIMLGEQDEELYEQTNNAEISLAFREAGEYNGS